ncbi:MAG: hypothetical protein CW691_07400 [Candidatus Bathyarchaeum sp.]|nr:MAG: hypothetical protein CW691_07400 [Candidatus Bathyarchaeum sp.]
MRKLNASLVLTIVFAVGLLVGTTSYAVIEQISQIRNVGTIRTIDVDIYQDQELTTILEVISWGTLNPGEAKSVDAWIKNTGNDAQKLVMWTENWNPTAAQNGLALSWNYADSWIAVNASIPVVFTLFVDANITGVVSFSFDIWVKGVH